MNIMACGEAEDGARPPHMTSESEVPKRTNGSSHLRECASS
jgi:hypothetical protein